MINLKINISKKDHFCSTKLYASQLLFIPRWLSCRSPHKFSLLPVISMKSGSRAVLDYANNHL
jgi:hypothetical protein